ncbi:MAG: NADH-quinone oxidoreductase subunit M [Dehalococcoidia bacterium]|nr:NADH-quinone oxidoreductase subunit M [Dehalococcoidia bacterium]
MLTFLVFFPALGAIVVATLPRAQERQAKLMALAVAGVVLVVSMVAFGIFDRGDAGLQLAEHFRWIRAEDAGFDVQYFLGVDGLGLTMVVLTTFLFAVAVLVSWNTELRPREYFAWLLVLETAVLGVFTAQDLILFFLFWELELIPMYFLISIWGSGRKEYSAMKFVLFTLAGSALMLAGFLTLAFSANPTTFDMVALQQADLSDVVLPLPAIFFLIFVGFAVKLPVVPLHTWLPDAHTDAPTAVSVILAGVLLKMGGYGMLRILVAIMPDTAQDYAVFLASLAAASIIYGAIVTLRQTDLKRLIAYSSVSHMGYVLLGIAALGSVGMTGATLQMFSHGVITGLLFLVVGLVYDRAHTRSIDELSGLAHVTPVIATVMVMAGLASLGLPATSGFVAEVTVFLGTAGRFEAPVILGVVGILLSAGYILWTLRRVMFGPKDPRWAELPDATSWWEQVPMAAMLAVILAVGLYPKQIVDVIDQAIVPIASRLG